MENILLFGVKCFALCKLVEFILAGFIVISTLIFIVIVFYICAKITLRTSLWQNVKCQKIV